ncbi:Protein cft1 [Golovinomyces cichoracearum]|uniref:Protein cft1 n=1 Tax=Golovinomyces cichoracearum TaxID=62708 RepID=A0A420IB36_9PEZI|nr:Protein cft1 [Golovinomyces cichoracearum]
MQCYMELTPPSGVTHSLTLPFISSDSNNLVVVKTSLLQIFTTKTVSALPESSLDLEKSRSFDKDDTTVNKDTVLENSSGGDSPRLDRARKTKLVLLSEYSLSGTVISLARVKILSSKSGGDALLVGLKDAKLSLLEWDPFRSEISTISIHYYEQDDLHGSPWASRLKDSVSYLTADPSSRCAALKFGLRNLAILPLKQGDEDVHMDEWENEPDNSRNPEKEASRITNGNATKDETPYFPSFVLRLPSLDPTLHYPIHIAFLYEYREPTFGILSSTLSPSPSLLFERKDNLTYTVFTLDLHQKASTTILSVSGLPFDLNELVPLTAPVGGALLIGANELIHIDQAGKANGVAVNLFAKQCTSQNLHDQSDLEMRLEGCKIEQLSIQSGEMIMILQNGQLAILSFHMDGRSVCGLRIRKVSENAGGLLVPAGASCISPLGPNTIFIGSENSDSVILGWNRHSNQTNRRKQRLELSEDLDDISIEDEDYDIDDDLYGDVPSFTAGEINGENSDATNSKPGDYVFQIHDFLINIGPISDVTFGKSFKQIINDPTNDAEYTSSPLDMVATIGKGRAGSLAIIHKNIQPKVINRFLFSEARGIWTLSVKKPASKSVETTKDRVSMNVDSGIEEDYDRLMIISKEDREGSKLSDVYALTSVNFEGLTGTEFEPAAGPTIEANTLGNGTRIIQVLQSEVRSYDGGEFVGFLQLHSPQPEMPSERENNDQRDFMIILFYNTAQSCSQSAFWGFIILLADLGLAQIMPMCDDDTGAEPKILSASFADPFLLLVRDDSSIFVAQCDENNELEEIEKVEQTLLNTKWLAGCIYKDNDGVFASALVEKKDITRRKDVMMFLLSAGGALHIYKLPDLSKAVYIAEGICFMPPILSPDFVARRGAARDSIIEILVVDLGDESIKSPYLILRSIYDDLTIYQPFRIKSSSDELSMTLRFIKLSNPHLAKNTDAPSETVAYPMRSISNIGGYSIVFLPGASPSMVLKSPKSIPKVVSLQGVGVRGLSSFHTKTCDRGFIYSDTEGIIRIAQLPSNTSFVELGISLQKLELGEEVHAVTYHPPMECYVVATSEKAEFELPKDDDHHRERVRGDTTFKPTVEQSFLNLINPINWSVIHKIELDLYESILCVKTLSLEVSEITNERRQLITVGTAICKGEDLPTKGRIYVYDIVTAVPEPDRPETNKRLKQIAKEEIARGPVTAVSEIGTQGFMLVSQGQKCMVRGLKEDGSLLPVAFMDMNCYVTSIKELRGTGLCVFSDIIKGVWFAGYNEEPYKMMLFGKSGNNMEVITTELLPDGKELYIVVADADGNLHILQYDPERKSFSFHFFTSHSLKTIVKFFITFIFLSLHLHMDPKSIQGHLLLHRSTFSLGGHLPTTLTLLPRTKGLSCTISTLNPNSAQTDTSTTQAYHILITSSTGCISHLFPLSEFQYRRLSTLTTHLTNTLSHTCGLNPKAYRIDRDAPESIAGSRTVVDGTLVSRWIELSSQRRAEVAARVGIDVDQIREDLVELQSGLRYL